MDRYIKSNLDSVDDCGRTEEAQENMTTKG